MTHLTPEANQALYADQSGLSLDDQLQSAYVRNLAGGTCRPNTVTELLAACATAAVAEAQSQGAGTLAELKPLFADRVRQSHNRIDSLLAITETGLTVPELASPELAHIDWGKLQAGYDVMAAAGLEPEVVIAPAGHSLSFWKGLYSGLRKWQDGHDPTAGNRLQLHLETENGDASDGLYVGNRFENDWISLIPAAAGWTVSVIPLAETAPFPGVNYNGETDNHLVSGIHSRPIELTDLLTTLPSPEPIGELHHPSVESYLTTQAIRLHNDEPTLDESSARPSSVKFSWLDGIVMVREYRIPFPVAPMGTYYSTLGQVRLTGRETNANEFDTGVRPVVGG